MLFTTCMAERVNRQLSLQNYPDGPDKVAGFVDYHLIELLQWDHIYTAPYFLALLALLGASLAACTSTRQWPMVRVARRYGAGSYFRVLSSLCRLLGFSRLPMQEFKLSVTAQAHPVVILQVLLCAVSISATTAGKVEAGIVSGRRAE